MFDPHALKMENLHIPLWLLKGTCWMFQWKLLGVSMIISTVSMAIYIVFVTRKMNDVFLNLAIMFRISANSYWMCAEFFHFEEWKEVVAFPFFAGIAMTFIFYYNIFKICSRLGEKNLTIHQFLSYALKVSLKMEKYDRISC